MKRIYPRHLLLETLEERVLLDANPVAAAVDDGSDTGDFVDEIVVTGTGTSSDDTEEQEEENSSEDASASGQNEGNDASADAPDDSESDDSDSSESDDSDSSESESESAESQSGDTENEETDEEDTDQESPDDTETAEGEDGAAEGEDADEAENTETAEEESTVEASSDTEDSDDADAATEVIDPLVGEEFTFTITMGNDTATELLYGPYVEIHFEGGDVSAASDGLEDGASFVSATLLGETYDETSDNVVILRYSEGATQTNPYTGESITLATNEEVVYILLPFGSYSSEIEELDITVVAEMSEYAAVSDDQGLASDLAGTADPNDITISWSTGFMYGADAEDNPSSDAPVTDCCSGSATFRPEVLAFQKSSDFQETEVAAGSRYAEAYTVTVDIADGQDVTDLVLRDDLSELIYFGESTDTSLADVISITLGTGTTFTYTNDNGTPGDTSDDYDVTLDSSTFSTELANLITDGIIEFYSSDIAFGTASNISNITSSSAYFTATFNGTFEGNDSGTDITFSYDCYVPEYENDGTTNILGAITGTSGTCYITSVDIDNDVTLSGSWTPQDPDDGTTVNFTYQREVDEDGNFASNEDIDDTFTAKAITVIKSDSVSASATTGDIVTYTLTIDLSEYVDFEDVIVTDVLADGLALYDQSGTQDVVVSDGSSTYYFDYNDVTQTSGTDTSGNDITTLTFLDLVDLFGVSTLTNTTLTLTYYVEIQDEYTTSGLGAVDQGDTLTNSVTVTGHTANGCDIADGSSDAVTITTGDAVKSIVSIVTDDGSSTSTHIAAGYTVTFELEYTLTSGDTEELIIYDFLPSPVFEAILLSYTTASSTVAGQWTFGSSDEYEDAWDNYYQYTSSSTEAFGIAVTVNATSNCLVFDFGSLSISSSDFATASGGDGLTIDLVFTLTVTDEPYVDALVLTNLMVVKETDTASENTWHYDTVTFTNDEPVLNITKSVITVTDDADLANDSSSGKDGGDEGVTTIGDEDDITYWNEGIVTEAGSSDFRFDTNGNNSTGGTADWVNSYLLDEYPLDYDLTGADAGDIITYAIIIENTGSDAAFDIVIADVLPDGYTVGDVSNFTITYGWGSTTVSFTGDSGDNVWQDLFTANGIEIVDDDGSYSSSYDGVTYTDGEAGLNGITSTTYTDSLDKGFNIIIITYDLLINDDASPSEVLSNTASILQYSNEDGNADKGINYVTETLSDAATVTIAAPVISKTFDTDATANGYTSEASTSGSYVAIGETVYYEVTLTIPEGTSTVTFTDKLDNGLAYLDLSSGTFTITASSGLTSSTLLTFSSSDLEDYSSYITFNDATRTFTIDFGTLTNDDRDNSVDETITITYAAIVLDTETNDRGDRLNNRAYWTWYEIEDGTEKHTVFNDSGNVVIVEPTLQVVKNVANEAGTYVDVAADLDEGDTVSYEITIQHTSSSNADAFDVVFTDILPGDTEGIDWSAITIADISYTTSSVDITGVTLSYDASTRTVTLTCDYLPDDEYITLMVTGGILTSVMSGQSITNTGTVTWTSLEAGTPGSDATTAQTTHSEYSTERTGDTSDPGGAANDYTASDDAIITLIGGIDKTGDQECTIGEEATFTLTVYLAEGTTQDLIVYDQLPDGLTVDDLATDIVAVLTSFDENATFTIGSTTYTRDQFLTEFNTNTATYVSIDSDNLVTINLGTVYLPADNVETNDYFTITVSARVENIEENYEGVTLSNHAYITYEYDGNTIQLDDATDAVVTIIEPELTATMVVGDYNGDITSFVETSVDWTDTTADNIFDYFAATITFENTGSSTAYDLYITDELANGTVIYAIESVQILDASGVAVSSVSSANYSYNYYSSSTTSADRYFTIEFDNTVSLLEGYSLAITYTFQAVECWFVAGYHENVTDANWSGISGTDSNERVYDDTDTQNPGLSMDEETADETDENDKAAATIYVPRGQSDIGDFIFYDLNDNGEMDVTDIGIPDVEVMMEVIYDSVLYYVVATTTADEEVTLDDGYALELGEYLFTHLASAEYTVVVTTSTLPGGGQAGSIYEVYEGDGTTNNSITVTVDGTEEGSNYDADFGYIGTGTIGDTVWYDLDGEGDQDETGLGISGATVFMQVDFNGDGDYEYTATTTTDSNGNYSFDLLLWADYTITVIDLPEGIINYIQTYDADGELDDTSYVTADDWSSAVYDASTDTYSILTQDFGYQMTGVIGDVIWNDANANRIQDDDEEGIAGVTVYLTGVDLNNDGTVETLSTVTAADGSYTFVGLEDGEYTIYVDTSTLPGSYVQTYDYLWDAAGGDGLNNSTTVTLSDNDEVFVDADFGYVLACSIGDTVWYDVDESADQNSDEELGLAGVTVTLVGDVDLDGDEDILTTTTDADGNYLFENLAPGTYTITLDSSSLPEGMRQTYDYDGLDTENSVDLTLVAGEDNLDVDFGYTGTGTIGDTVWYDTNEDGRQNNGESGISGVVITLTGDFDNDGSIDYSTSATTDAAGLYLFTNLPAGVYTITIDPSTLPNGYVQSYDPDGVRDYTTTVTLGAGEEILDLDFGFYKPETVVVETVPPVIVVEESEFGDVIISYLYGGGSADPFADTALGEINNQDDTALRAMEWLAPVYTGWAEPGTTLTLTVYDVNGNTISYQTVMADAGGNWLASFNGTSFKDMPRHMVIGQSPALYNHSTEGMFNLRVYFNPAVIGQVYSSTPLDLRSITAYEAGQVMESLHREHYSLLELEWDKFPGYEFFSSSTNPSNHGR